MIVVADASPLSNLAAIGKVELLRDLYGRLLVPDAVAAEFRVGERRGAHHAFIDSTEWIEIRTVHDRTLVDELRAELDLGEAEAIVLSTLVGADLLLVDERAGRRIASERGLRVVGTLGSVMAGKAMGLVPLVRPILDALRSVAGFWVSEELYAAVLERAGE